MVDFCISSLIFKRRTPPPLICLSPAKFHSNLT